MTNYGKSPASSIIMNQKMSIDGGKTYFPSYGGDGKYAGKAHDKGNGQPPTGITQDAAFSAVMSLAEAQNIMAAQTGISIRIKVTYQDLAGNNYLSGICYLKTPESVAAYCKANYRR
jgi:hypothetical protein